MERLKNLLRSTVFWGTVCSIAAMAIIAIAFFYPDSLEGNVLQQHDTVQGMSIGHETQQYRELTGEQSRWTNSLFSGMPTFQISPSYPSNSLFSWIDSVMGLGLPNPSNLLFMMMTGFFILLMVMRMRWHLALIGAIAYGLSSYFVIIIGAGHIWKFVTLAYIPPTMAGIILCYRGRYLAGGALTSLFAMMQIAANHVQMTYYFLFVAAGFVLSYFITAYRTRNIKKWLTATGVVVIAGLLAVAANLPSLYNTYEYSKQTIRGGHSELTAADDANSTGAGLDRDYITQYSYGEAEMFSLLIPNIKGGASVKPEKGINRPLTLGDLEPAHELYTSGRISPDDFRNLHSVSQYFGEPEGTNGPVYVGALIVALFILGCIIVRGPLKWVLIGLTVFSILLALGRNCMWFTDFMLDYVPMYNKFRTPESILVIAEFTMPLLAIMALRQIFTLPAQERWQLLRKPLFISFGLVLLLCIIGIVAPGLYGSVLSEPEMENGYQQMPLYPAIESLRHSMVSDDAMRSFLIVAAGFGVIVLFLMGKLSQAVSIAAVGVIVFGDLFSVNKRYVDHESFMPRPTVNPEGIAPTVADAMILESDDELRLPDGNTNYRVLDLVRFSDPQPSYFHKMVGGYHAAKLTRYQDVLDYYFTGGHNPENIVDMLNVRYIIQDPASAPIYNANALGNAWFVDKVVYTDTPDDEMARIENMDIFSEAVADRKFESALGASVAKVPGDTIVALSYAPNRLTYSTNSARGGVAVLSEIYFPWGWKAVLEDGTELEIGRVNYVLRAVRIPAGKHELTLTFDPESIHTTTFVAYIAIILIYVALAATVATRVLRNRTLCVGNQENSLD